MAATPDLLAEMERLLGRLRVVLICHPDDEAAVLFAVDRLDPELLPGRVEVSCREFATRGTVIAFNPVPDGPPPRFRFERPFVNDDLSADPPPPAAGPPLPDWPEENDYGPLTEWGLHQRAAALAFVYRYATRSRRAPIDFADNRISVCRCRYRGCSGWRLLPASEPGVRAGDLFLDPMPPAAFPGVVTP